MSSARVVGFAIVGDFDGNEDTQQHREDEPVGPEEVEQFLTKVSVPFPCPCAPAESEPWGCWASDLALSARPERFELPTF